MVSSISTRKTSRPLKVLALHGRGTSADIFRSQTVVLRQELADEFEFTFLDGEWECDPYPSVDLFWPGPYRSHYDTRTGIGLIKAINRVATFARENGPFDGIMGFSQGAALSAAVLAWQRDNEHLFDFGILMCGGCPTELGSNSKWTSRRGSADSTVSGSTPALSRISTSESSTPSLSPSPSQLNISLLGGALQPLAPISPLRTYKLQVPTAHFIGKRDPIYESSLDLFFSADPESSTLWEFDDGHTIPRTSAATAEMADHIRRAAHKARQYRNITTPKKEVTWKQDAQLVTTRTYRMY
ncbi:hypothetical protein V8E36_008897 [Tilletia maclaganii]